MNSEMTLQTTIWAFAIISPLFAWFAIARSRGAKLHRLEESYSQALIELHRNPTSYEQRQNCTQIGRQYYSYQEKQDDRNSDPLCTRYSLFGQLARQVDLRFNGFGMEDKIDHDIQHAIGSRVVVQQPRQAM
jgi:hypothetical protein